jgi:hypothetical protein
MWRRWPSPTTFASRGLLADMAFLGDAVRGSCRSSARPALDGAGSWGGGARAVPRLRQAIQVTVASAAASGKRSRGPGRAHRRNGARPSRRRNCRAPRARPSLARRWPNFSLHDCGVYLLRNTYMTMIFFITALLALLYTCRRHHRQGDRGQVCPVRRRRVR